MKENVAFVSKQAVRKDDETYGGRVKAMQVRSNKQRGMCGQHSGSGGEKMKHMKGNLETTAANL